jgi:hypothetical protein
MGNPDFASFVAKLKDEDTTLKNALLERFGTSGEEIPVQQLIDFAAEQGFAFREEDANDALSHAQLEGVTGGVSTSYTSITQPVRLTLNTRTASFTLAAQNPAIQWDHFIPGDEF